MQNVATKKIYLFEEGNASMKDLLGGKGANLAEMTNLGFPVPPGFTITTEMCNGYSRNSGRMPEGLMEEVAAKVKFVEGRMDKKFGDAKNPLLFSVRSGAKFSMPGMMDTVLNLGLNDETVKGLASLTKNDRFAYDSYRRFVTMFGDVVLEIERKKFDQLLDEKKKKLGVTEDQAVTFESLRELVEEYKELVQKETGKPFPQDVLEQLRLAIEAVFRSWNNPRAFVYRNKEKISHDLGTAVNVQTMVFGNMGDDSGTGVAFTRNASTGENVLTGDFLFNAQGEDVVAGIRTPLPISAMKDSKPSLYDELSEISRKLEKHYRDLQDMEFTIQQGKLFMLQTRSAKRTAPAAIKIAVDMANEGLITKEEALMRITPEHINWMLHPYFPPADKAKAMMSGLLLAKGTPASPGAASGRVYFEAEDAIKANSGGESVVLVRPETTPDDAQGMLVSRGILTSTGGPTSHAALVARGWGIPCVVGCEAIQVNLEKKVFSVGGKTFKEGDFISIDGGTGEVMSGEIPMVKPTELSPECQKILSWADETKNLGVYANADNPRDAQRARNFGATGIGLCRTEHMFMEKDRLPIVQEMIMAGTLEARKSALAKLLPVQRGDFYGILKAMEGYPVIIRLLDPPLHEFLPSLEELLVDVTTLRLTGKDPGALKEKERVLAKVRALHEFNPMLGLRVCRLGIVFPEIYEMQVRAIFEAACQLTKEGVNILPEVMIPGVGHINEMRFTRDMAVRIAEEVMKETGIPVHYKVGTMVELPRACVIAGELATVAEFFSFGTNDLSQTTFGYSRDDASKSFIPTYIQKGILLVDPFAELDRDGVGALMKMAVRDGRAANSRLEVGICGEHGGDPSSIEYCHILGLNYVSCSPYRVPVARLAAAQAKIREKGQGKAHDIR